MQVSAFTFALMMLLGSITGAITANDNECERVAARISKATQRSAKMRDHFMRYDLTGGDPKLKLAVECAGERLKFGGGVEQSWPTRLIAVNYGDELDLGPAFHITVSEAAAAMTGAASATAENTIRNCFNSPSRVAYDAYMLVTCSATRVSVERNLGHKEDFSDM